MTSESAERKLQKRFKQLIADRDGIKPEEVTFEYIQRRREQDIYPKIKYRPTTNDGYDLTGLKVRSRDEIAEVERRVTEERKKR